MTGEAIDDEIEVVDEDWFRFSDGKEKLRLEDVNVVSAGMV